MGWVMGIGVNLFSILHVRSWHHPLILWKMSSFAFSLSPRSDGRSVCYFWRRGRQGYHGVLVLALEVLLTYFLLYIDTQEHQSSIIILQYL